MKYLMLLATVLVLCLPSLARAATLNVPSSAYPTIQSAVNAASNGDTVLLADGTYTGDGNRDIDFGGKNLTVTSQHGATSTIINCGGYASTDGSGNHRGFYLHSGETSAVISRLTVRNGYEGSVAQGVFGGLGGGVAVVYGSSGTLTDCMVTTSKAFNDGSGVFNSGTVTLSRCTLTGNSASFTRSVGGGAGFSNTGTAVMTNCTVSGNFSDGGSIENANDLTMTNCVVTDNIGQTTGGGIYNAGKLLTMTNCTVSGNISQEGRGGGIYSFEPLTLTNDIIFGDTGSEIDTAGGPPPVVSFCDIQGGYAGTGNINADPLFVSATDFHLQPGSPCLEAGTASGASTMTIDGKARPNPPSIGAYEMTPITHVLWTNTSGAASIWNYDADNGSFAQNTYGPYPGWAAKTIAENGLDGLIRVLWDSANGQASLWSLDNTTSVFSQFSYGPYAGWTANALSVSSDGTNRLLWNNSNGRASLWNQESDFGSFTPTTVGPYPGWTAHAIAADPSGSTQLLWDNADGRMTVGDAGMFGLPNPLGQTAFGPYPGWTANAISIGTDGTTHILWDNTNGTMSLWNYNTGNSTFTQNTYGPYPGWTATAITDGSDGKTVVLWDNVNGAASIWSLDNTTGVFSQNTFGPYPGWTAAAVSGGN